MGWKQFSQIFKPTRQVDYRDMKGLTVTIDAMTEIYRAALGGSSVTMLTDATGKPTLHINVILSMVLELQKNNITQIWVFDHNQDPNADFHNPDKLIEMAKRRARKEKALAEINSMSDLKDNDLFSDEDDDNINDLELPLASSTISEEDKEPVLQPVVLTDEEEKLVSKMTYKNKQIFMLKKKKQAKEKYDEELAAYNAKKKSKAKLQSLEKQSFTVDAEMINDVKLILNCFGIKFMEAPEKFEGEHLASYLNMTGKAHAVLSSDTDPMAFGAKILFRRNPRDKIIYEYTEKSLLEQIAEANENIPKPDKSHILKCALISGNDYVDKTPGVGPKTILKKLHSIDLNADQKAAIPKFTKEPDMKNVVVYNDNKEAFVNNDAKKLLEWLVVSKKFTRSLVLSRFSKVYDNTGTDEAPVFVIKQEKPKAKITVKRTVKKTTRASSKGKQKK